MTHEERVRHHMYDTLEGIAEQSERIASLEELVLDMWHLLFDWLFKNHEVPWKELEAVHDRMRELGVTNG